MKRKETFLMIHFDKNIWSPWLMQKIFWRFKGKIDAGSLQHWLNILFLPVVLIVYIQISVVLYFGVIFWTETHTVNVQPFRHIW